MRLPKFWKDSGGWNEPLLQLSIGLPLAVSLAFAYLKGPSLLTIGMMVSSPVVGFIIGLLLIHVLCTYFSK